jgi:hypothetical protein
LGSPLREEELAKRDRVFDLAIAVLEYDRELRKHPDAPSLRENAGRELAALQAHYVRMRSRAAQLVREIARASVRNGRP